MLTDEKLHDMVQPPFQVHLTPPSPPEPSLRLTQQARTDLSLDHLLVQVIEHTTIAGEKISE